MPDAAAVDEPTRETDDGSDYSGLLGAFRYGFRRSDSLSFKSYAVVSAAVGTLLAFALVLALIRWFVATLGQSPLATSANAFLGVIALFVLGPLFAPVIFVARRHRRGTPVRPNYDALLALAGYGFLVSLYVGLVISVPPEFQSSTPGAIGAFLYSLPQLWGLVPPVIGATLVFLVHRLGR